MDLRIRVGHVPVHQPAAVGRGSGPGTGFQVTGYRAPPAPAAGATASVAAVVGAEASVLLGAIASPRDQLARRRGRAMLRGLDALQRDMLAGTANADVMRGLAGLLDGEDGEDPELTEALRALALRARIELVRRGIRRGEEPGAVG